MGSGSFGLEGEEVYDNYQQLGREAEFYVTNRRFQRLSSVFRDYFIEDVTKRLQMTWRTSGLLFMDRKQTERIKQNGNN
jgi:hypothetical protein